MPVAAMMFSSVRAATLAIRSMSRPSPITVGSAMVAQRVELGHRVLGPLLLVPVLRVVAADLLVEHEHVLVHQRGAQIRGVDRAPDGLDLCHALTVAWCRTGR